MLSKIWLNSEPTFFIDKEPQPAKKKTGAGAVKNRAGSATLLTIHVVTKKSFG